MKVMAKYKLPTGQVAIQSWVVDLEMPDEIILQMAQVSQPEYELLGLIKFPDGINQEFILKEQSDV